MDYDKGINLIEASAGTGKTYTLCRIVLSLMLEKAIPVDRILAVTYTEAATLEMKNRIRELLEACLSELEARQISENVLKEIIARSQVGEEELERRIRLNLELFEEAPIFTIHGFCKRALELAALESSTPMEADIDNVEESLIQELRNEFIRTRILEKSHILAALFRRNRDIESLLETTGREFARHPHAIIEPVENASKKSDLDDILKKVVNAWDVFQSQMNAIESELIKNRKFSALWLKGALHDSIEQIRQDGFPSNRTMGTFEIVDCENFKKAFRKGKAPFPEPEFIKTVESFLEEAEKEKYRLARQYRNWLSVALAEAKQRNNTLSFNDLLHRLSAALRGPRGGLLAELLRERYDAALIDEFQDTDPTQYSILDTLFNHSEKFLFFIGDPKQAIYRFRGADVFAYLNVADNQSLRRYSLSCNYRSAPKLVSGLNALFSSSQEKFVFEEIKFDEVESGYAEVSQSSDYLPDIAGLYIHSLTNSAGLRLTQDEKIGFLCMQTTNEIGRLLSQTSQQSETGVSPEDIAILVNTNDQADRIQNCLTNAGIKSSLMAERSVFITEEIGMMTQLLTTLDRPYDTGSLRALLLTPICGLSWETLPDFDLETQNQGFEDWAIFLSTWKRDWERLSFDKKFREFLKLTQAEPRLLENARHERAYTDLMHLSELLDYEKRENANSPLALRTWLERQSQEDVSKNEGWQVRLGSDQGKVRIITIHKSKGLEFPIVFCPFLSLLRPKEKAKAVTYHTSKDDKLRISLNPTEDSEARELAQREDLAEQIRLIYVALTRAKFACHAFLAPEESARRQNPSAFAQLVLGSQKATRLLEDQTLSRELYQTLGDISATQKGSFFPSVIDVQDIQESSGSNRDSKIQKNDHVSARPIRIDRLASGKRVTSFTSISKGIESGIFENREIDEIETQSPFEESIPDSSIFSIHTLPKGVRTGDLLHGILENADLSSSTSIETATQEAFEKSNYGFFEYKSVVAKQIKKLAGTPLASENATFKLRDVPDSMVAKELEFAYRVKGDIANRIAKVFRAHSLNGIPDSWISKISNSSEQIDSSFLRGFIDSVFEIEGRLYIFDWKSNHLGYRSGDYDQDALAHAMSEHDYYLQYCLYCVALYRQVAVNWSDRSFADLFGGVFYVFLRGIQENTSYGIFYDNPSIAFIQDLSNAIDGYR